MPSRSLSSRRRGDDVVLGIARRVAGALRVDGFNVRALSLLGHARAVQDQSALSLLQRRQNLRGAFEIRAEIPDASLIVIDDVITSGASMGEALRTLAMAQGSDQLIGGACAAATSLREGAGGWQANSA